MYAYNVLLTNTCSCVSYMYEINSLLQTIVTMTMT